MNKGKISFSYLGDGAGDKNLPDLEYWIFHPIVYHSFHSIVYQRFTPKFTTRSYG